MNPTPPNTNPSPKLRFRESSDNISKHKRLIELPEFDRACAAAQAQMNWQMVQMNTPTANDYAVIGMKMAGVHEFLAILRNLAEAPASPLPKIVDRDNLREPA
jgi:hypothetical protein